MNCNKSIKENISEELFLDEVEKSKKCISDCLKINVSEINKISDEYLSNVKLDNHSISNCRRIIFDFHYGLMDCYLDLDRKFIEIFHFPKFNTTANMV